MMNTEFDTTPIINIHQDITVWTAYMASYERLSDAYRRSGQKPVDWVKSKLGPQAYCMTGEFRYWVWEDEAVGWRVYVANQKGISFEVNSDFDGAQAQNAWEKFQETMGLGGPVKVEVGTLLYDDKFNYSHEVRAIVDGLYVVRYADPESPEWIHHIVDPEALDLDEFSLEPMGVSGWVKDEVGFVRRPITWVSKLPRDGYQIIQDTETGLWYGSLLLDGHKELGIIRELMDDALRQRNIRLA